MNGYRRFGVAWPAIEWTLICTLMSLFLTAGLLRVERAQREQNEAGGES